MKRIFEEVDFSIFFKKNNFSFDNLILQIKSGNLQLLHQICNYYISIKREKYLKSNFNKSFASLNLDEIISKKSYRKAVIFDYSFWFSSECVELFKDKLSSAQLALINNKELLDIILSFMQDPAKNKLDKEQKKYVGMLNDIINIMYDNKIKFDILNDHDKYQFDKVQRNVSSRYLLSIISELNIDGLNCLLDDDNLFLKLKSNLVKYKMLGWQDTFFLILKDSDLSFNEGTLAGLISNFDKIVNKLELNFTLTSIIDYANCYSSVSQFYSLLFGTDDFNYIAANPGKNRASMMKVERLTKNANLIVDMYGRNKITIPPINGEFVLPNQKKISINLGNFTNMINLTYGERTNSCMRKGGPFDDLYDYCIKDPNGFNIRFTNPSTGAFVSKVSGIRNGNTVFLNELRCSLDDDYTNDDLYMALKQVVSVIVNESKNSGLAIDYVLVTADYALESHKNEIKNVGLTDRLRKVAIHGLSFNLITEGIILAGKSENMQYNLAVDIPHYTILRDDVREYNGQAAVNRMIQLHMINDLLNGVSVEDINSSLEFDVPDYLLSGEDFYISFINGETKMFIFDKSKNNTATTNEINEALKSAKRGRNV